VLIVLLAAVALLGACAALLARAIALPRVRAAERLDQIAAYGFAPGAPPMEEPRPLAGAAEGLAATIGVSMARRLSLSEADVRKELMSAGMYTTSPYTLIGHRLLCAIGLPAIAVWVGSTMRTGGGLVVMLCFLGLFGGWMLPMLRVRRKARGRLERIDDELPELVDVLVVTVESGLGFASSLQIAAQRFNGPLGDELRLAFQEQSLGLPTEQALANMLDRSDTPALRSFVRSIRQGEQLGVSIGQILRNLAVEMRKRRQAAAEERAQKAPIKILFPLIGLIFPALFIVLLAPAVLNILQVV
jgi:tight adherence protein C